MVELENYNSAASSGLMDDSDDPQRLTTSPQWKLQTVWISKQNFSVTSGMALPTKCIGIHYIIRQRRESIWSSVGVKKKPLIKVQHQFMVITFRKLTLEWNFHIVKSIANIYKSETLETFPVKSRRGHGGTVPTLLFKPGLDCITSIQPYTAIPKQSYE